MSYVVSKCILDDRRVYYNIANEMDGTDAYTDFWGVANYFEGRVNKENIDTVRVCSKHRPQAYRKGETVFHHYTSGRRDRT